MVEHLLAIEAFLFGHPPTPKKEIDKLRPESENLKKQKNHPKDISTYLCCVGFFWAPRPSHVKDRILR